MKRLLIIFLILALLVVPVAADAFGNWTAYGDAWKKTNATHTIVMWNATGSHSWLATGNASSVEYLVVAGGGGGGSRGGGGAGGILSATGYSATGIIAVVVATGGISTTGEGNGGYGGNSTFGTIITNGGGGGGRYSADANIAKGRAGLSGGSTNGGGAGGGSGETAAGGLPGGTGYSYGRNGGASADNTGASNGGGGGTASDSTGLGGDAPTDNGGAGGRGSVSSITGTPIEYAGGGGGAGYYTGGTGYGGGGNGANNTAKNGYSATPNSGGGGGAGYYTGVSGAGGSGVVIIRYLTASGESPISSFTHTPSSGTSPLSVQFNDTSSGTPTTWNWSYEGHVTNVTSGIFSTLQNPSATFTDGNYTIALNTTNAYGYNLSTQISWVNTSSIVPLVSSFTQNISSGTTPLTVTFTDTTTGYPAATSWNWTATNVTGNNTQFEFSTSQSPTATFRVGNFSIQHTATSPVTENTSTQVSWVNVSPMVASFVGSPLSGTVPFTVSFSGASTGTPTAWSWNFGDGNVSTDRDTNNTYYEPGVYTVSLTATNGGDSDTETKVGYITAAATSTTDLYMDPLPFTLTLTFTDASTGAVIPNVGVTDNLLYTTSTTTGIYARAYNVSNMSSPVVYLTVSSDGYTTRQLTYEMTEDITETVVLTSTTVTPSTVVQVYPKYVTFHLKDGSMFGAALEDVQVSVTGISTSTGNWDWIVQLLGIPLSEVALNSTAMYQTTDSFGMATFYVIPTAKYNVTFTKAGYTIPPMIVVPQDDNYIVTAASNESPFYRDGVDELSAVNITVTSTLYNSSHAFLNMTYHDSTGHTTGGTIQVLQKSDQPWTANTVMATWPVPSSSFTNSTVIVHIQQVSGYVNANITHSDFGTIKRSFPYSFNSVPVEFLGFGRDITLIVALGIMMLTMMLGGAAHARIMVVIVDIEGWIFYTMHWFQALFDRGVSEDLFGTALLLVLIVGILANILMRKKRGL